MPSVAAQPPQGGSIQQCLTELGINIALLGTQNSTDNSANIAALEEALAGPFRKIVDQVKEIIFGDQGILNEIQSIINEFVPTSVEQLLQQMKEAPTRLIGGIINAADTLVNQLYQYGSAEVGQVLDQIKKLFQGLLLFSPETILGIGYQALVFGLPSVMLQKRSLGIVRKLVQDTNKDIQQGKIPKQINPSNPFSEAIEELCKAKKDFQSVEDELINKNSFNKGFCGTGTQHIFKARDCLIEGKNSAEFLKNFAANQFGITDEAIAEFSNRQWLPPIEIGLRKEGIIALMRPISQTNNNIKTMQDNLSGLIEKLQLNIKFENILVLFIRFIKNEIARYQNALLAATGDPRGNIQQWENNRNMLANELAIIETNPSASEARKAKLIADIKAYDAKLKVEKEKVKTQSPESFNPGSLINSLAVQVEVAIGLTILGQIAKAICTAIDKLEKIWSKVSSLSTNSWFKKFNDILEGFNPANCPKFMGNQVLCNMGKYLDALNERLTLKEGSSDQKVISLGRTLLKSINDQLLYLECIQKKLTQGSKDVLAILLALGLAALVTSSWIMNGMSMQAILAMLGLDFEFWFLKSTASSLYESILKALVCIIQSCDNPGMTRFVNQLMTRVNADKKAEDTRSVDFRHMAKESQFNDTFSTNSRIKFFMDMLGLISGLGFSLCVPGSSGFDPNKTKENDKQVKKGNTFERTFCSPYATQAPQSALMGKDPKRVQRVFA
jgi:hypothetical protein